MNALWLEIRTEFLYITAVSLWNNLPIPVVNIYTPMDKCLFFFFFFKLAPGKFLKEVHERVCMNSPCKSKGLHSQPRSSFQSYIPKP